MNTSALFKGILVLTALVLPSTSRAQVPLVWQTTFAHASCPDKPGMPGEHWKPSDYFLHTPGARPCPGTGVGPHQWSPSAPEDRITTEANYPGGGGGKGFRHYRGDGTNVGGNAIQIDLGAGYPELWGRFYMRYQLGFAWLNGQPHYSKDLYVNVATPSAWVFGIQGSASWGIFNGSTSIPSSKSWVSTMGGSTGDGQWHCYEWHIQHGAGARIEIWVDEVQVLNTTTNMPAGSTRSMAVGENQNLVAGAGAIPWYTDYDDFAFSTSGRIGCLGPPGQVRAPTNLRVR